MASLVAPYNTAVAVSPIIIDGYLPSSMINSKPVIERRSGGNHYLLRHRQLADDEDLDEHDIAAAAKTTCIRITTGPGAYNDGYLNVYIDSNDNNNIGGSSQYIDVASGYHSVGSVILEDCYSGHNINIQVQNIESNAWSGSIESSVDNGVTYSPMICTQGCTTSSSFNGEEFYTSDIVVDGNSNGRGDVKCMNGQLCTLSSASSIQDNEQKPTNICIDAPNNHDMMHPGDILYRGEFLCYGNLRFGIDIDRGQFVVGFVNGTASSGNATNVANNNDNDFNPFDDPAGSNYSTIATPDTLAWVARPTSLFIPRDRAFSYIELTEDGNIFGYDDNGLEIYDSNYDYYNRIDAKEGNSILRFDDSCKDLSGIDKNNDGDGDGEGSMCVILTSPPRAGSPYGMVTWGVEVDPDDIVPVEPYIPTPAPIVSTPEPTISDQPTTPKSADDTPAPTRFPTAGESSIFYDPEQSLGSEIQGSDTTVESVNYEDTSIVWGTVWLDKNRNGAMDLGEEPVSNFTVELYECSYYRDTSVDNDDDDDRQIAVTDDEGAYFFQIPTGRTYRVKFEIDHNEYGYSQGIDTDMNMLGWTECETSSYSIPTQWNAGLYRMEEEEPDIGALPALLNFSPTPSPTEQKASIGGFIYLDVDEDGIMDSKERTAAVGGYTVNDAMVVVSLTNCKTDDALGTREVEFPGTYSFGNLEEGLYKLRYEMQVISRSSPGKMAPLYSFVDSKNGDPTVYVTPCGKLDKKQIIDSGNVGLRPRPLNLEPNAADFLEDIDLSLPEDRAIIEEGNADGNSSFVPVLVGVLVTLSIVGVAFLIFIKRRQHRVPFAVGSAKSEREDLHSVGSSVGWDTSMISAAPSGDQPTAIGSLVGEQGSNVGWSPPFNRLDPVGGNNNGNDDDESQSDKSDSCGSSDSEEKQTYTGMEFALRNTTGASNNGESPYQSSYSTPNSTEHTNTTNHIEEVHEDGSEEGYEVYDDEEDAQHGDADYSYGPVISQMIAKYSQQQQQNDQQTATVESQDGQQQPSRDYSQEHNAAASQDQTQGQSTQYNDQHNHGKQHHKPNEYEDETSTSGSSFTSDPPAASYKDIPAGNVAWNMNGGALSQTGEQHYQYGTANQYMANDGEYYEVTDDNMNYDNTGGAYHVQPHDDASSSSSSESSESSEEASNSGWSSSSSTAASSAVGSNSSANFNWQAYRSSTSSKDKASRRASSNPRDDRRVGTWRHQAAIPEDSTWEYNSTQAVPIQQAQSSYNNGNDDDDDGFTPTPAAQDDNISTGSDHSSDPPGANYTSVDLNHQYPPPPPPPPRHTSPNTRRTAPNTSPMRRQSPNTSPNRRGFPPPPPPRAYSTPRGRY